MSYILKKDREDATLDKGFLKLVSGIGLLAFISLTSFAVRDELLPRNSSTLTNKIIYTKSTNNANYPTMLLGIFSTQSETDAEKREIMRAMLRSPDGDKKICPLFELVKTVKTKESTDHNCGVAYAFVIGAGDSKRPKDHKDKEPILVDPAKVKNAEADAIYLNIKENSELGKSLTYFKYGNSIADEFGIDYFAKTEMDTLISTELLLEFVADDLLPRPYNKRVYGGRWEGMPERNLFYGSGQFYFMSADLAKYITKGISDRRKKELMRDETHEDGEIGIFIHNNVKTIKFMNLSYYKFWYHPVKTSDDLKNKAMNDMKELPERKTFFEYSKICPAAGFKKK